MTIAGNLFLNFVCCKSLANRELLVTIYLHDKTNLPEISFWRNIIENSTSLFSWRCMFWFVSAKMVYQLITGEIDNSQFRKISSWFLFTLTKNEKREKKFQHGSAWYCRSHIILFKRTKKKKGVPSGTSSHFCFVCTSKITTKTTIFLQQLVQSHL